MIIISWADTVKTTRSATMFWIQLFFTIGCGVIFDGAVARYSEVITLKPMVDLNRTKEMEKIVGGKVVTIKMFPYQVGLLYMHSFQCGGSIISNKFVLTAAHCVYDKIVNLLQVRAGSSYLDHGGRLYVVWAVRTPSPRKIPDIAVLRTEKMHLDGVTMKTVRLAKVNERLGPSVVVSGWGTKYEDGPLSTVLRAVTVPVTSRRDCKRAYKKRNHLYIFCAGVPEGGKDACQGDSGGPAVVQSLKGPIQIGVVSGGLGCARPGYPGHYASVPAVRKWIYKVTGI